MPECTEAERELLEHIISGDSDREKERRLHTAVARERITPEKREAMVTAWVRSIQADEALREASRGLPPTSQLWDETQLEARKRLGKASE